MTIDNILPDAIELAKRFSLKELQIQLYGVPKTFGSGYIGGIDAFISIYDDDKTRGYYLWFKEVLLKAIELKRGGIVRNFKGKLDVEGARERADMVAIVEGYGIRLKKSGKGFTGLCPFHNEKSPSFYIDPIKKTYKCFGCQEHGDFIDLIMKLEKVDFKEAVSRC
jgi:hypothetical protein